VQATVIIRIRIVAKVSVFFMFECMSKNRAIVSA
jgi:hypothetical protein